MNDDVNRNYNRSVVESSPLEVMFRSYLNRRWILERRGRLRVDRRDDGTIVVPRS
jgi:hypothetical protein